MNSVKRLWPNFNRWQWAAHIGAWLPVLKLAIDWFGGFSSELNINPFQELTFRTGWWALTLFTCSLACTPLQFLTRQNQFLKIRRALGLYGFFYALAHFLLFLVGYGLVNGIIDVQILWAEIFKKQYAFAGLTAFLLMLPLALTSNDASKKQLGKDWKTLHKVVYVAVPTAVVHYIWLVKTDIREPLVFGAIAGILLLLRVPRVKQWVNGLRGVVKKLPPSHQDTKL